MTATDIKVVSAALQDHPTYGIVLRGAIDPHSLHLLQADDYQREVLSGGKVKELEAALRTLGVPDIFLGIRGQGYTEDPADSTTFYLPGDQVFIIDGLQRVNAALQIVAAGDADAFSLGGLFRFGTDRAIERSMFDQVNTTQTGVSASITLRNQREVYPAIDGLYLLSTDERGFILVNRVSWNQRLRSNDLITAMTFAKVAGMLHSHLGPGRSSKVLELAAGIQRIADVVGLEQFLANVREFFNIIDQCWNVNLISYRSTATHLKLGFMVELARVFSDHTDFWRGDRLFLSSPLKKKVGQFGVQDMEVDRLAGGNGSARIILYNMMIQHINAGRRTGHLRPRKPIESPDVDVEDDPDDESSEET
jgi:hypothetical protein